MGPWRIRTALFLLAMALPAQGAERDYVHAWCQAHGGIEEYRLEDGTRVDCLLPGYAVEADFAHKWAEAVGQALHYAAMSGREPGVLLIVGPEDWRFAERLFSAIQEGRRGVRVWFSAR